MKILKQIFPNKNIHTYTRIYRHKYLKLCKILIRISRRPGKISQARIKPYGDPLIDDFHVYIINGIFARMCEFIYWIRTIMHVWVNSTYVYGNSGRWVDRVACGLATEHLGIAMCGACEVNDTWCMYVCMYACKYAFTYMRLNIKIYFKVQNK